jgi:bleomycin hydrolase
MGAEQSKPTPETLIREKLIVERVQALSVQDRITQHVDDEYVRVDTDEKKVTKHVSLNPTLSASAVGKWQYELLQDPKNRSVLAPTIKACEY